jgi:hypothetical protein
VALLRGALLLGGIRLADVPTAEEARRLLRHLLERDESVAAWWDRNVAAPALEPLSPVSGDEEAMLAGLEQELQRA